VVMAAAVGVTKLAGAVPVQTALEVCVISALHSRLLLHGGVGCPA
jgi:hypothetical protein